MPETQPLNILVVDDDPLVRRFVAMTLGRNGFTVHVADNGDTGLQYFSEHGAGLAMVLTDVVMPGLSGPEMVERMLAIDPEVRVMFMTGTASDARLPSRNVKTYQLIHKPFTPQGLLHTVRDCLANCK
jgi:two-component system cell cycle sensor histidine kinase/response regulator CckA